ncbi:MAG: cell division protein DivIVA, partial [Streptococcus mitis]|nr:cell division protein DivIVA [Streptococcus mitis]
RHATDNAKKVAVETEELKNKSRVFHQRLKSTIESQLAIVESSDWEDILRPTATYLQTSDEAFKEVVGEVLGESVYSQPEEEPIDMTRQFTPEEMAELQARIEAGNRELAEFEAQQHHYVEEHLEPVEVEAPSSNEEDTNKESVLIL